MRLLDRLLRRADAWRGCMCDGKGHLTRVGQIALNDLVTFSGLMSASVKPSGHVDPVRLAYAAGKRDVALRILEFLGLSPLEIAELRKREAEEERANAA